MNHISRATLDNLWSKDREVQNKAFAYILEATNKPITWAYDVWNEMLENLNNKDNHNRAIAAQILCSLAKSDPANRMLKDFDALLNVTRDERFVTARHCLQSLWKIGVVGKAQQTKVIAGLEHRFTECSTEKNCTLIRYDIIENFRKLYDNVNDNSIKEKALALIESEDDLKYRKKYSSLWKNI
jgi:hypothetical protein